jgi:hypothetical protein
MVDTLDDGGYVKVVDDVVNRMIVALTWNTCPLRR